MHDALSSGHKQCRKCGVNRREDIVQREESREKKRVFKVYTIVEKPGAEKSIWLDIGVGVLNRDDSISVKLDALPVNGILHIRDQEPRSSNNFQNTCEKSPSLWRRKGSIE